MNNRLIEAARSGRPPTYWRAGLYLVAALTLPLAGALVVTVPVTILLFSLQILGQPQDVLAFPQSDAFTPFILAVSGVFEAGTIAVTVLWVPIIEGRPIASIGLKTRAPAREWARGLLVGAGMIALVVGVMTASGSLRIDGRLSGNPAHLLGIAGMMLFFIVQGPAEEVMFRGYLLPVLSARDNVMSGVVVSALVFGALHAFNPHFGLLPLVNIVLAGVMFALYALVEEGLWGVFGLHTTWNWVQGNVFGMPVSGGVFGPSLVGLQEAGPDWLTGGAFGPEGSVIVTGVLVAVSAGLAWRLWRRQEGEGEDKWP